MAAILDTVLPFFALIFCGYGVARFRVLNAFVFTSPCLPSSSP